MTDALQKNHHWEVMYDILVSRQQQGVPRRPESQYNDYQGHRFFLWVY